MIRRGIAGVIPLFALLSSLASAAPVPECTPGEKPAPFLNETFEISITLANQGDVSGYGPALELFLPQGLELLAATAFDLALTVTQVGTFEEGTPLQNPLTGEDVYGPTDAAFSFVRYPLSAMAPTVGPMTMTLLLRASSPAEAGVPLDLEVTCLFALGDNAVNDPSTDPPPRSDDPSAADDQLAVQLTPSVIRAEGAVNAPATVTGPGFPVIYTFSLDVADGVTVNEVSFVDQLDDRFQLTEISLSREDGVVNMPESIETKPGGTVDITFPTIEGVEGLDAEIVLTGFVPELDSAGLPVLDPMTGAPVEVGNEAVVAGFLDSSAGGDPVVLGDLPLETRFSAHSILVYESIENATRADSDFRPGDKAAITLKVDVSDYFVFDTVALRSSLSDGLLYEAGSASIPPVSVDGTGPTLLNFHLGPLAGGEEGGTGFVLTYRALVKESYADSSVVYGGDVLVTGQSLEAELNGSDTKVLAETEASGSDPSVQVQLPTFEKTIYTINDIPATPPYNLRPGDVVTFRLRGTLWSGDQKSVVMTDYLPSALFLADEQGLTPNVSDYASGRAIRVGPEHTVPKASHPSVSVSPPSADNSITFSFDAISSAPSKTIQIDLLAAFTVQDAPVLDQTELVNMLDSRYEATDETFTSIEVLPLTASAPDLVLTKGVTATDNPNAVFTPSSPGPPYTSAKLEATPEDSDVARVDAADVLTFTLVVENRGGEPAYDVVIADVIPDGLSIPGSGSDLRVTNGLGFPVSATGDLFGAGLRINGILPPYDPVSGTNLVVIAYDLQVGEGVQAHDVIAGDEARILSFGSSSGGANFVGDTRFWQDGATVTIAGFGIDNNLLEPVSGVATVQDVARYEFQVTVPEGVHQDVTLRHTVPDGDMAFIGPCTVEEVSSALTTEDSFTLTVNDEGGQLLWALGDVTNDNRDNSVAESLRMACETVVLNQTDVNQGDRTYTRLSVLTGGLEADYKKSDTLLIQEPRLTMDQTVTPAEVDAGDEVSFEVRIGHLEASMEAYDLEYHVTLPEGLRHLSAPVLVSGEPFDYTLDSDGFTWTMASLPDQQETVFSFGAVVEENVSLGDNPALETHLAWTGQPGESSSSISEYSTRDTERTGSGDPEYNDYFVDEAVPVPVAGPGTIVKTLVDTSLELTDDPDVAAGERVTYLLAITLAEGSSADVAVIDTPPRGLTLVSVALDLTGFEGSVGLDPSNAALDGASGEAQVFALGEVVVSAGNVAGNNTFHLEVVAVGTFDPDARETGESINEAVLVVGGSEAPPSTVAVRPVYPEPVLFLEADETSLLVGEAVTLTAVLENPGDAPACRLEVDMVFPGGLEPADPATDGLDNDGDGAIDNAGEFGLLTSASTIALVDQGCVAAGEARTWHLKATAVPGSAGVSSLVSASLRDYSTLESDDGELVDPLADGVDNNGDGAVDEAGDQTVYVSITALAPAVYFTKTYRDENGGEAEPGDIITYVLTLESVGSSPAQSIVVTDTIPADHTGFVPESATSSIGPVSVEKGILVAEVATLPVGATATVTFQVKINAGAWETTIENQAFLTAEGLATQPSDDPDTAAPLDSTTFKVASSDDRDQDGIENDEDIDPDDPDVCLDSDFDTCDDCAVASLWSPDNDGPDSDSDGLCDAGELTFGTDPEDADSDDDGLSDGDEPDFSEDTDGDGLINARDPDSDDDGLVDGTEAGITSAGAGTDVGAGIFVPDADPSTTTDPLEADTDGGGADDGAEDANLDGRVDALETDPNDPSDDDGVKDSDHDGLSDAEEATLGSDPDDADTDDDGLIDGLEPNPGVDTDGDGLINVLDPDSDDDLLFDGTEHGVASPDPDTDETAGHFIADEDPSTVTYPLVADSDGGGVLDGPEDTNHNGRVDSGETDPNDPSDDDPGLDSDGDTIPNDVEGWGDTDGDGIPDALDPDSDGDGVSDADEAGDTDPETPPINTDGDDLPDFQDTDSDNDGVEDGEDNCRLLENSSQEDQDADGKGDLCDSDADGDGFDDGLSVSGGGCSHREGPGSGWLGCAVLVLLSGLWFRGAGTSRFGGSASGWARFLVVVLLVAAFLHGSAHAQESYQAFPAERFRPNLDGQGVPDVESGTVLEPFSWNIGLWVGFADDPLVVSAVDETGARSRVGSLIHQRLGGGLTGSVTLMERFALGLALPVTFHQAGDDQIPGVTAPLDMAVLGAGDVAVSPKVGLFESPGGFAIAVIPTLTLPAGAAESYFRESGVTFVPELVFSGSRGGLTVAADVAYRIRSRSTVADLVVDDELLYRLGAGYDIKAIGGPPLTAGVTLSGATNALTPFSSANQNPLELLASLSLDLRGRVRPFVSAGLGLNEGFGSPDWRVVGGVRLSGRIVPSPEDADDDGIIDSEDSCPNVAEDLDGFQDEDGCPDPDNDLDGIPDDLDRCPNEPEDQDGLEDTDGCPEAGAGNDHRSFRRRSTASMTVFKALIRA